MINIIKDFVQDSFDCLNLNVMSGEINLDTCQNKIYSRLQLTYVYLLFDDNQLFHFLIFVPKY